MEKLSRRALLRWGGASVVALTLKPVLHRIPFLTAMQEKRVLITKWSPELTKHFAEQHVFGIVRAQAVVRSPSRAEASSVARAEIWPRQLLSILSVRHVRRKTFVTRI